MKKMGKVATALTLVPMLFCSATAKAQVGPFSLTLNDAIRRVVEQNLDVKVELYNPALAQADIGRALGIYDPLLNLEARYDRSVSPNAGFLTPIRQDIFSVRAGASQLLPTGGTAGVTLDESWHSNPVNYYSNNLNFFLSQPLLKNFGKETTELNISVARFGKAGALERFRVTLSDVVAQVRSDYFRLYSLREDLEVKKTSYALADRILSDTRGRVNAGVLPAMEILNAEFGVAQREKDVIEAERAMKDQMDLLRLRLQLDTAQEIVTTDLPTQQGYSVSEPDAILRAMSERPELAGQRVSITINDLQKRVNRNRLLPDLTLDGNVGFGGFDPSFGGGMTQTFTGTSPMWGVGVKLSYPLGNHVAENDYIRSRLLLEQSQTQLRNLEATVANEVRSAIRAVSSSFKQLDVTKRGRAYAEERLVAFQKKNAVGLATTKDVFDVLNDLVTAKGNQIRAVVDYNNAITQLWRATGEILDRQGIKVTEQLADQLYNRAK